MQIKPDFVLGGTVVLLGGEGVALVHDVGLHCGAPFTAPTASGMIASMKGIKKAKPSTFDACLMARTPFAKRRCLEASGYCRNILATWKCAHQCLEHLRGNCTDNGRRTKGKVVCEPCTTPFNELAAPTEQEQSHLPLMPSGWHCAATMALLHGSGREQGRKTQGRRTRPRRNKAGDSIKAGETRPKKQG